MDNILLSNMIFYGYHGVYEHERKHGQRFGCDVELFADFSHAAKTDDLSHAVDYTQVYSIIQNIMECEKYKLMEALAGRIAEELLSRFPLQGVRVCIRKPGCPLPGAIDYIQVELTRGVTR